MVMSMSKQKMLNANDDCTDYKQSVVKSWNMTCCNILLMIILAWITMS